MTLLLADVDTGSNTPSMVGKVLAWKKAKPEEGELTVPADRLTCAAADWTWVANAASRVWDGLKASNGALALVFAELGILAGRDAGAYEALLAELAVAPSSQWSKDGPFTRARDHILVRTTRFQQTPHPTTY